MFNILKSYAHIGIKRLFIYRIRIASQMLEMIVIPITLYYFFWKSIIDYNPMGYTLPEMIRYIIISNLILTFTHIHADQDLERGIRNHNFGQSLLKPISFVTDIALKHIMESSIKFLILYVPIIVIVFVVMGNQIALSAIVLFIPSLIMAFVLNATLSFLIGFMSFWITETWGIAAIRNILLSFLTGTVIPLDLFPQFLQKILLMLPFPYISYVPAKILCEPNFNMNIVTSGFAISSIWICLFFIISYLLFTRGISKYTARGV